LRKSYRTLLNIVFLVFSKPSSASGLRVSFSGSNY